MSEKTSILLSDVTVKGDIVEKETLVIDSKVDGDITAGKLQTHSGSNINGNISASDVVLGGSSKGNINLFCKVAHLIDGKIYTIGS